MSTIALIPARAGSKGIPGKNFRQLGGKTLVQHAVDCARAAGIRHVCVSTDNQALTADDVDADVLWRGPELSADDTPMLAVVQDFIARMAVMYTATNPLWTGKPAQQTINETVIVLLQPTAPFRTPQRVQEAIALLQESGADSVVSVVPLPLAHSPSLALWLCTDDEARAFRLPGAQLQPWEDAMDWWHRPTRRQDVRTAYRPDGTVYAFWRKTVDEHDTIYGQDVRPLILDPAETCELDTEADWLEVERRWKERHAE